MMMMRGKVNLIICLGLSFLFSCVSIDKQNTTYKEYMDGAVGEKYLELYHETYGKGAPSSFSTASGATSICGGSWSNHWQLIIGLY